MSNILEKKLDNPVWNSLSESHRFFCISNNNVKFYHPDYCPFGGTINDENNSDFLIEYAQNTASFFVVGTQPQLPRQLKIKKELICCQMLIANKINLELKNEIVLLGKEHYKQLFELVNLVQPGYFMQKTPLLGNYYGIFNHGKLIAATGERMQMHDFTEVSAVVTHPEHTGKGYAKQLIAVTVNNIIGQNKMPFLHVADTNLSAIGLYEKLGFSARRNMSFWNIEKTIS